MSENNYFPRDSPLLLGELPRSILLDGREWPINWDFRTGIAVSLMLESGDFDDIELLAKIYLTLVDEKNPPPIEAAFSLVMDFYKGGESPYKSVGKGGAAYDFSFDSGVIYASFWQQYGIDLSNCTLHWWSFKALLSGLSGDTPFGQVLKYRSMEISSDMSSKERQFYTEQKRRAALPERISKAAKEAQNAVFEALSKGGDISNFIFNAGGAQE